MRDGSSQIKIVILAVYTPLVLLRGSYLVQPNQNVKASVPHDPFSSSEGILRVNL